MSNAPILYTLDHAVAAITLNRPDRLNALTGELLTDLAAALDRAVADGARCVLLTGAGRAFCSGLDLALAQDDLGASVEDYGNPVLRRIAALPMPIVTAVNGPAAGAGASLAMAGDIILMGASAYYQIAFVNVGLVPDVGSTWFITKAAGRTKALELMMLGEKIYADKAEALGLATRVLPDIAVLDEATALARRLAHGPTVALGLIRKMVPAALTGTFDEILDLERDNQRIAGHTADARAAIAAFINKSKPEFTGK